MDSLTKFISTHRNRFVTDQGNIFVFSWGKVLRRGDFLKTIEARYIAASAAFVANSQRQMEESKKLGSGPVPVPPELAALMEAGQGLSAKVHLEIESYYLFAKIVLDDIARAIEYYFGKQRGLAIDSHDDLTKRIRQYAAAKGLTLSDDFVAAMEDLKKRVCDFRDQNIAHEKSPRTMQGTSWGPDGAARIMGNRIYPNEKEIQNSIQTQTDTPPQLATAIESYLDFVVDFLSANETKTTLRLEAR
jgi:hypothetical protein